MFNKAWFLKHQKLLLWLCNTPLIRIWFRWILHLNGDRSSVGNNKIVEIYPNAIRWFNKYKYSKLYGRLEQYKIEFRTHDKFAKRLYYSFKPFWYILHAWDSLIANTFNPNWNLGFDTLTVYPDANEETNTVDGQIQNGNADYATCRNAAAGNGVSDSVADDRFVRHQAGATIYIARSFFLFDTSALSASATISAATFSLFGSATVFSDADNDSIVLVSSTPASNTGLVVEDYDQLGATSFGSIDITSWSQVAYNDFTVNSTGQADISKTAITKYGCRTLNDINASAPTGTTHISGAYADTAGTTSDPKLVVTYTLPTTGGDDFAYLI